MTKSRRLTCLLLDHFRFHEDVVLHLTGLIAWDTFVIE